MSEFFKVKAHDYNGLFSKKLEEGNFGFSIENEDRYISIEVDPKKERILASIRLDKKAAYPYKLELTYTQLEAMLLKNKKIIKSEEDHINEMIKVDNERVIRNREDSVRGSGEDSKSEPEPSKRGRGRPKKNA